MRKYKGYRVYSHDEFKNLLVNLPKAFYIYTLLDGDTPIYVGKGTKKVKWPCQHRALQHEKGARLGGMDDKSKYIRKMLKAERQVGYVLEFMCNAEHSAFFYEQVLIGDYGKRSDHGTLFNRVDGGQGMSGYKIPASTRKKMSITRTGRTQSLAHNKAISLGRLDSENVKRDNERRKIPVRINNKQYNCVKDASVDLKISMSTLKYRISVNWPGYERAA